jgi:hypothetical protein
VSPPRSSAAIKRASVLIATFWSANTVVFADTVVFLGRLAISILLFWMI